MHLLYRRHWQDKLRDSNCVRNGGTEILSGIEALLSSGLISPNAVSPFSTPTSGQSYHKNSAESDDRVWENLIREILDRLAANALSPCGGNSGRKEAQDEGGLPNLESGSSAGSFWSASRISTWSQSPWPGWPSCEEVNDPDDFAESICESNDTDSNGSEAVTPEKLWGVERPELLSSFLLQESKFLADWKTEVSPIYNRLVRRSLRYAINPKEGVADKIKEVWAAMRLQSRPKVFWQTILTVLEKSATPSARSKTSTMREILDAWETARTGDHQKTACEPVALPCAFRWDRRGRLKLQLDATLLEAHDSKLLHELIDPLISREWESDERETVSHDEFVVNIESQSLKENSSKQVNGFQVQIEVNPPKDLEANNLIGLILFRKPSSALLAATFFADFVSSDIVFDSQDERTWSFLDKSFAVVPGTWDMSEDTLIYQRSDPDGLDMTDHTMDDREEEAMIDYSCLGKLDWRHGR